VTLSSIVTAFSLMTWNAFGAAQGLVSFLRWRGVPDAHRFTHPIVRETAAGIDVLCMQEIFLSEAEDFFDALDHGHKHRDDNATSFRPLAFGGSGLGIASRLPIVTKGKRTFAPPHVHSERFARKGMLHVRVAVADASIDVVTTHMQSGVSDAARAIRKRQLAELRSYVDASGRAGSPMIVCGDLNIDGLARAGRTEYADLARTLHDFVDVGAPLDDITFDTEHNALAKRHAPNEPPQRLDYVFVSDPSQRLELTSVERALHVPLDANGLTFASDHYAVTAHFDLR
jgi:endonuclease/exonuclease/phosphatase family metal-dependent hydrolase